MTGEVLAPLRARYAYWLGLDEDEVLADRDEAAEDVRALQLILRMERDEPPSWHTALVLAATASAAVCLDPRSEPGGEWHEAVRDYCAGHIRKVTRRARGAQWEATADLPGLSFADGATQVRALVPGRVQELDKRVSKLQVGGTDVEPDPPTAGPGGIRLQIWLPPEPVMTLGKAMAQTGHAGMIAAALLAVDQDRLHQWITNGLPAAAVKGDTGPLGGTDRRRRRRRVSLDRAAPARRAGRRFHRGRSGHGDGDRPGRLVATARTTLSRR